MPLMHKIAWLMLKIYLWDVFEEYNIYINISYSTMVALNRNVKKIIVGRKIKMEESSKFH